MVKGFLPYGLLTEHFSIATPIILQAINKSTTSGMDG